MNNIIILEDNIDLADGLRDVLEAVLEQGVVTTDSGLQALAYVAEQDFTIGLFDVNLPEMNGVATLKEIRRQGYSLPIIFMTGFRLTQLVNEVFPQAPVNLLSEPDILSQIDESYLFLNRHAITFAYGTDPDEMVKVDAFCLERMGFCQLDVGCYDVDRVALRETKGLFYKNVVVTEALAHALYLREQGFIKPIVVSGIYTDNVRCAEPYTRFDVTGCVFKPFDLQNLLELIMKKMTALDKSDEHGA